MRFFVTGTLGHCCPHLIKLLLKEGHEVGALIRTSSGKPYESLLDVMTPNEIEQIVFEYGDLVDYQSLLKIFTRTNYDGVFHLGAQSSPPISFKDPIGTMNVNLGGTVNLVEAIANSGQGMNCVIMNCSTSEVYGDQCKETGILREDMRLIPNNPYGWSKMCAETYLMERCKNGFSKGFSTRAFSHLAPRRGKNFSISWDSYYLALMATGNYNSNKLPVGNLKTKRIVIDARDVVKAYYLLMKKFNETNGAGMNGESFNVCGDIKLVKEMSYFTDKLIEISKLPNIEKKIDRRVYRPIDIQVQIGDTAKLKSFVNWTPTIPIEQTLEDIYKYWIKKLT